eukprot:gene17270-biopygen2535
MGREQYGGPAGVSTATKARVGRNWGIPLGNWRDVARPKGSPIPSSIVPATPGKPHPSLLLQSGGHFWICKQAQFAEWMPVQSRPDMQQGTGAKPAQNRVGELGRDLGTPGTANGKPGDCQGTGLKDWKPTEAPEAPSPTSPSRIPQCRRGAGGGRGPKHPHKDPLAAADGRRSLMKNSSE